MAYIGSTPTSQNFTSGTDYFSGTGSQTAFTLTRTVNSVNDIEVVINNVVQQPSTAYTLSGTTITFTSAPSSGTNNIYVRYLATNMQSFTVPANSITRSHLDSNLQAGFQGRNKIINGHMVVDQRNAGASVTIASGSVAYPVDRFRCDAPSTQGITAQQVSANLIGFQNALLYTAGTASTNAADQAEIVQFTEGYNVADMQFGTSDAKTFTFSFWVKSSLTGTFGLIFENSGNNRQYLTTYSIPTANTWTYITKTIVGDTTGTWLYTNGRGIGIRWDMGVGTTYSAAATNAWGTSSVYGVTGTTKLTQTTGATFYITGVQLEEGTTATSFERETYSVTLQKCQRYYEVNTVMASDPFIFASWAYGSGYRHHWYFKVTKRATPTFTAIGSWTNAPSVYPSTDEVSFYNGSNSFFITGTAGQAGASVSAEL